MQVLLLTEGDVRQVLTMEDALDAVEQGLRKVALDEGVNIPRSRAQTDHCMLHVMSASSKSLNAMGYKAYTTGRKGAFFHVGLYDGKTGELLALMHADYLGQVRTGAASGVATKYLARVDAATLGVYGSGKQARTQLQAICKVRKIVKVRVFSPNEERRAAFAREMSAVCGVEVEPVSQPELAARGMDVIATATTSRAPVLLGEWLSSGTHINAAGSNFLGKAEVDVETLRRCNLVVADSIDQARIEAGDFVKSLEAGVLKWAEVRELGSIVVGRYPGRENAEEITLFKSVGLAIEDVATAARVYASAQKAGVGKTVEW